MRAGLTQGSRGHASDITVTLGELLFANQLPVISSLAPKTQNIPPSTYMTQFLNRLPLFVFLQPSFQPKPVQRYA